MKKLVNPELNISAGLPSRPNTAKAATASGRDQPSRSRPPRRAATSPATQASAARQKAKLSALHCTYGHSRSVRPTSVDAPDEANSVSDQSVVCNDGYHWFHAIDPSTVGHVVLPTS